MSKEQNISVMDSSTVLERIGGDLTFLDELLDLYTEEYSARHKDLQKAVEQSDFIRIAEIAHGLKGASANLSLTKLQKASYELELSAKKKNKENVMRNFHHLDVEFQKLSEWRQQAE